MNPYKQAREILAELEQIGDAIAYRVRYDGEDCFIVLELQREYTLLRDELDQILRKI
jgi:hypothetical protein